MSNAKNTVIVLLCLALPVVVVSLTSNRAGPTPAFVSCLSGGGDGGGEEAPEEDGEASVEAGKTADAEQPPEPEGEALCPEDSEGIESFQPPFPYKPTEETCATFLHRKNEVCRDAVATSMMDALSGSPLEEQSTLHAFHLVAQCECFPRRREMIADCVGLLSCEGFATCVSKLSSDDWTPEDNLLNPK